MSNTNECQHFLQWALPRLGLRREGYRKVRRQVCRKIQTRIGELRLPGFAAYRVYLEDHPEEWSTLDTFTRITISRFFRDYKSWQVLGDKVLAVLAQRALKEQRALRCWSAGCASGEEAYSLALVWRHWVSQQIPGQRIEIIATDIDGYMLQRAADACYPGGSIKDVPKTLLKGSFRKKEGLYCLDRNLCEMVTFLRQDIRQTMPDGPFDLIFCKNLVGMYFEQERAVALFRKMTERLTEGGILLAGSHEPFHLEALPYMTVYSKGLNMFRKKAL
ncbi:MAG: CheR family methyltransferase [Bacteroidales bacterium]|nr:CheR family methyltransferase [Bacteroidales bacterium]